MTTVLEQLIGAGITWFALAMLILPFMSLVWDLLTAAVRPTNEKTYGVPIHR